MIQFSETPDKLRGLDLAEDNINRSIRIFAFPLLLEALSIVEPRLFSFKKITWDIDRESWYFYFKTEMVFHRESTPQPNSLAWAFFGPLADALCLDVCLRCTSCDGINPQCMECVGAGRYQSLLEATIASVIGYFKNGSHLGYLAVADLLPNDPAVQFWRNSIQAQPLRSNEDE